MDFKNLMHPQALEIARIIGEPRDPRQPYPEVISECCETFSAAPDEHVFYYDVLPDTDTVYSITTGGVTASNVTPDSDAEFTFLDTASPEYYVKLYHLASAKEPTLARKKLQINRALDAKEVNYLISLLAAAASARSNQITLGSGVTTFNVDHLAQMIDKVIDYGDKYKLLVSNTIYKDWILWNWSDNKNIDIFKTFDKLGVSLLRIPNQQVTIDSSAKYMLTGTKAYLVAQDTQSSVGKKPVIFVRRRLNDVEFYGAAIKEEGDKPERLVFVAPTPMNVGGTRYLGVGLTGYESIVAAVTNSYGIAEFSRS